MSVTCLHWTNRCTQSFYQKRNRAKRLNFFVVFFGRFSYILVQFLYQYTYVACIQIRDTVRYESIDKCLCWCRDWPSLLCKQVSVMLLHGKYYIEIVFMLQTRWEGYMWSSEVELWVVIICRERQQRRRSTFALAVIMSLVKKYTTQKGVVNCIRNEIR